MRSLAVLSLHTSPLVQPGSGDSGGMNVYVRELVAALAQAGVRSEVYVRRWADDLPEVWADPDRLDQILSNLLENAVRHGEGVVTLAAVPAADDARAAMAARGRGEEGVELCVSDEGKGIPVSVIADDGEEHDIILPLGARPIVSALVVQVDNWSVTSAKPMPDTSSPTMAVVDVCTVPPSIVK